MQADRTYRWLLLGLACLAVVADQASKYTVFRWLDRPGQIEYGQQVGEFVVLPPRMLILEARHDPNDLVPPDGWLAPLQTISSPKQPFVNNGALFGMKFGESDEARKWSNRVFMIISLLAAIGIVVWASWPGVARDRLLIVSLGLILGGTIGNLYDRAVFGGVRDFIHFQIVSSRPEKPVFDWPVFNLADCCLVCGAILLAWQALWAKPEPTPAIS